MATETSARSRRSAKPLIILNTPSTFSCSRPSNDTFCRPRLTISSLSWCPESERQPHHLRSLPRVSHQQALAKRLTFVRQPYVGLLSTRRALASPANSRHRAAALRHQLGGLERASQTTSFAPVQRRIVAPIHYRGAIATPDILD